MQGYIRCLTALAAFLLSTGVLGPLGGLAMGQQPGTMAVVTPVFGQLVAYSVPQTFTAAGQENKDGQYIQVLVPEGENLTNWTQSISLIGAKGMASNPNVSPEVMVANLAMGFKKTCPTTYSGATFGALKINGAPAFSALASCGTDTYQGRTSSNSTLFVVIKGAEDYYTLQWAELGPPSNAPIAFDNEKWRKRFWQMSPIKLCQRVEGERPPYQSCMDRK